MAVAQPIVSGTPAAPLRLYLIRHGETEWSLASKHTSRTDIALNAQGEEGARRLGQKLRASEFNRVFTSPSRRAIDLYFSRIDACCRNRTRLGGVELWRVRRPALCGHSKRAALLESFSGRLSAR